MRKKIWTFYLHVTTTKNVKLTKNHLSGGTIGSEKNYQLAIYFIGPLPLSKSNTKHILVIIDICTKKCLYIQSEQLQIKLYFPNLLITFFQSTTF